MKPPHPVNMITALTCGLLLLLPRASFGQTPRTPVATTPHFAFFSDYDTNLNDALVTAGLARKNKTPELFHAGDETACFDKLPASSRAAWDAAVDYYAKVISPAEWNARPQFLIRLKLVGFDDTRTPADTEFLDIAAAFRAAAGPAYRACRWTAQDAFNRRWIDDMLPRLKADEATVAKRLTGLYKKTWATLPILVDVVETVNWSGANTSWSDSGQGDILISREPRGAPGFETLFHESSHVLMDRDAPIQKALNDAAKAANFTPPSDLWHLVLFYTTGEAVRRILDDRGPAGYTPMLYEIFKRGSWAEYRQALETAWLPYVEGKRSLPDAATALIAAIRK